MLCCVPRSSVLSTDPDHDCSPGRPPSSTPTPASSQLAVNGVEPRHPCADPLAQRELKQVVLALLLPMHLPQLRWWGRGEGRADEVGWGGMVGRGVRGLCRRHEAAAEQGTSTPCARPAQLRR